MVKFNKNVITKGLATALLLTLTITGCNSKNVNMKEAGTEKQNIQEDNSLEMETQKLEPEKIENVNYREVNIGDSVEVDNLLGKYAIKVDKLYISTSFEEDPNEWNYIGDTIIDGNNITDGSKIIYAEYEITNNSDTTIEYYLNQFAIQMINDIGQMNSIGGDVGYSDVMGKGKNAYQVKIEPGQTQSIRAGYIYPADIFELKLYAELTGESGNSDSGYVFIPIIER